MVGKTSTPEGPARRVSFSELLGGRRSQDKNGAVQEGERGHPFYAIFLCARRKYPKPIAKKR